MKIWQAILLAILLAAMPVLSACDLLGLGDSQAQKDREYYEQQLEAYKKVQEANRKAQEDYNERLRKGLQEYSEAYSKWQKQQLQTQIEAAEQQLPDAQSANQTKPEGDSD